MNPTLEEEHEALLQFLYLAPTGLVQTTADGEVAMINACAARLLMPLAPQGDLTNLFGLLDAFVPGLRRMVADCAATSGTVCDGRLIHTVVGPPDRHRPQILALTLLKLDAVRLMAVLHDVSAGAGQARRDEATGHGLVVRDASAERASHDTRRRAHLCDPLTGIASRRTFFEAAQLELARHRRAPRPIALVLVDADHLKRINERHGHPAGDAALQHLARVAEATLREVDVLARVGGEEFAILMPSTDLAGARVVADRFRQAIADTPYPWEGATLRFTVSCGVAVLGDAVAGIDGLMQQADRALQAAKRAGRNRISSATADTLAG